jgi:hypothetical protein
MEETNSEGMSTTPCCASCSDQEGASVGTPTDCGCAAPPANRPWLKTLIVVIVMLAAVAVGAYSLFAEHASRQSAAIGGAGPYGSGPTTTVSLPGSTPPSTGHSSCCGGSGRHRIWGWSTRARGQESGSGSARWWWSAAHRHRVLSAGESIEVDRRKEIDNEEGQEARRAD